ncbi:DUF1992 domain-containing protein [Saccharopolyspora griseoalba]|uniref:DnaJ family domain-containing protein n=1 Tax=Saccharopolyspora griseoalba TaxID=1431848 RepID=A0ABW2LFS9_9PSEU
MSERKPPGVTFESWVDRQIRTAQERGDFDNLPGAGEPLPGAGETVDENWWIKDYIHREGISGDALLPPPLRLRKEIERLPDTVAELTTEQAVRDAAHELNRRIAEHLRAPIGPQIAIAPVDVEGLVERWRADRPRRAPAPVPEVGEPPRPKPRWWHRFRR